MPIEITILRSFTPVVKAYLEHLGCSIQLDPHRQDRAHLLYPTGVTREYQARLGVTEVSLITFPDGTELRERYDVRQDLSALFLVNKAKFEAFQAQYKEGERGTASKAHPDHNQQQATRTEPVGSGD